MNVQEEQPSLGNSQGALCTAIMPWIIKTEICSRSFYSSSLCHNNKLHQRIGLKGEKVHLAHSFRGSSEWSICPFGLGACGKGAYQWSSSSHGQRIQEKEEGTRVSQSPGMTQKPPTRPHLRKRPPSLSCATLGTKVLNTWAFGGGAQGGNSEANCSSKP